LRCSTFCLYSTTSGRADLVRHGSRRECVCATV
jgi:hypothetical protein